MVAAPRPVPLTPEPDPLPLAGDASAELTAAFAVFRGRHGAEGGVAFEADLRVRLEAFLERHGHTDEARAAWLETAEAVMYLVRLSSAERAALVDPGEQRAAELGDA